MADRPLPESFEDKIREYIVTHYQDDPSKFNEAFKEIATMRNTIMRGSVDVESVCVMKRYYGQLVGIKKRFPMEEGDPLAVPFSWADRALDLPTSLVYEDIDFELCCIMFNIGAAHALIAANESRNDLDSIKNSFMHFQCAAYPIQYLRDQMGCGKYSALDFEPSFLTFYLNVMLAQAQECLLEKSMIDQRKPLVIAKVAFYLRDVYKQCVYHLDNSGISELVSTSKFRTFVRLCSTKSELYAAIGNFYLGHKAEDEKNMGLREANARRENDFIYHERVTKPEDLEKLEGVVMVKPIAFDPFDPSIAGEDLFKSLLPTDVIKAISIYAEEKARFKREIYADVEAKDNQLDNYLISLQLDQLHLNEPIDQMRLPDELLQSSAAFSAQPDSFPDLLKKFDKVMSTANEAENKLSDLRRRLSQVEDAKLKQDEGFQAINAKLEELTSHHVKAKSNNIELQRAMASHSENLKLLAMPLAELSRQICGQFIDPSVTTEGSTLRKMLDKVDEMRKQRCKLMSALNEDLENDDIARKALAERDLDPKKLFEKELDKHSKTINMIQQNMTAQETILKALTEANANFAEFRRQIMESNEQKALQSLTIVTAFQVFMDVTDKTDQALNFYTQLFSFISALSKGVEHIEAAKLNKKLEAERVENEKRAAREAAETMRDFSLGSVQPHARTVQPEIGDISSGPPPPSSAPQGTRPRRGDYMSYYRNKMAPASPAVSTPLDPPNKQPQVQVPYSNQQAYGASQMHAPNHPAGHYLPNSTYSNPGVSQFTANCSNLQPMRPYPPSSTPNNQLINTNPSNYNPSNDITYQAQISTQISAPNATHHSQQYTYQSGQQAGYPIQQPISQHSDKTYQQSGQQILPSQPTQTPAILPQTYYQYANQTPQNSRIHQYSSIPVSASSKPSEQQHQQPPQIHHLNQQYAPTSYTPSPAAPMGTLASARHQQAYQPTASMDPGSSQTIASIASMPASFALAVQQPKTNSAQPTYTHPAVPRPAGPAAQTQQYTPATVAAAAQVMPKPITNPTNYAPPAFQAPVSGASPWHQNISKQNPYVTHRQEPPVNSSSLANAPGIALNTTQPSHFSGHTTQGNSTMYQGVEAQQTGQAHTIYQDNLTKSANIMKFVDSVMDQPTIPAVNNQIVQSNVGGENIQSTRIIPNSNTETVLSVNNNSLAPAPSQQQPPKTAAVQTPITTRPPATGVAVVLPIARQQHKHQQNTQQQSCPNVSSAPNMPSSQANFTNSNNAEIGKQGSLSVQGDLSIKSLLDPNTFELGQGDKAKLEKQMLRKEFREHGLEAQLPGLDTTDPLNTLDAHYWLAK